MAPLTRFGKRRRAAEDIGSPEPSAEAPPGVPSTCYINGLPEEILTDIFKNVEEEWKDSSIRPWLWSQEERKSILRTMWSIQLTSKTFGRIVKPMMYATCPDLGSKRRLWLATVSRDTDLSAAVNCLHWVLSTTELRTDVGNIDGTICDIHAGLALLQRTMAADIHTAAERLAGVDNLIMLGMMPRIFPNITSLSLTILPGAEEFDGCLSVPSILGAHSGLGISRENIERENLAPVQSPLANLRCLALHTEPLTGNPFRPIASGILLANFSPLLRMKGLETVELVGLKTPILSASPWEPGACNNIRTLFLTECYPRPSTLAVLLDGMSEVTRMRITDTTPYSPRGRQHIITEAAKHGQHIQSLAFTCDAFGRDTHGGLPEFIEQPIDFQGLHSLRTLRTEHAMLAEVGGGNRGHLFSDLLPASLEVLELQRCTDDDDAVGRQVLDKGSVRMNGSFERQLMSLLANPRRKALHTVRGRGYIPRLRPVQGWSMRLLNTWEHKLDHMRFELPFVKQDRSRKMPLDGDWVIQRL